MSQLNDDYDIIPLIWEGDQNTSPNYGARGSWYNVLALPTAVFGGEEPDVGGGDTYPRYVSHYNAVSSNQSPLSIELTMDTNEQGDLVLQADVEVTGEMTTSDNILEFIVTYNYSDSYFCTVQRYYEEEFTLTSVGETAQYTQEFAVDSNWDLAGLTGVMLVQTNEGEMTGGEYPVHTRAVLQGAKATLVPNSIITGAVTDFYTSEPIEGAVITAGSYETTTTTNGGYTLSVINSNYEVSCSAEGYDTSILTVTAIEDDVVELNFELSEQLLPPIDLEATVDGGSVTLTWGYPEIQFADFEIVIKTDNYPAETSWDLVDESGTVIAGISAADLSAANSIHTWPLEIPVGTYTFTIYDSYGDGICCQYGNGYYNLNLNGNEIASGGEFASSESTTFDADAGRDREVIGYNVWERFTETPLNGETLITDLNYTVSGLSNGTYFFTVSAVYPIGESDPTDAIPVTIENASNDELEIVQFSLQQNFPNPFNPITSISYSIPELSLVTLKVYDISGREVATLVNEMQAGNQRVFFDASELSSGVYIYRLNSGNQITENKMILLK
ncbi:MAG: T9SS type A sorting domain-containing protein [Candidatus Marinimicrobia bacterium]|nr:T9SS type A sorting domain-containing protein [Candidatus Neomarinimicrobiota bacterium]MBL7023695.1 T9SS type A sorting domain-containing protein [Candidatus Neomarinimicrobiota bacterium]MBL7110001.1 T9SS type A sorting domain-containing protein [Candidatus Neomarinimicrobiota bacterium]